MSVGSAVAVHSPGVPAGHSPLMVWLWVTTMAQHKDVVAFLRGRSKAEMGVLWERMIPMPAYRTRRAQGGLGEHNPIPQR